MRAGRLTLVAAAAVAAVAPVPAGIVERWYSQGLYVWLQPVVSAFSSLVPVALLDIAALGLLAAVLVALIRSWRSAPLRIWLRQSVAGALVLAAVLYLWFLFFWGLNYRRVPLEQKLSYDPTRISREHALKMAWMSVEQMNALAPLSRSADAGDAQLAAALEEVQRKLGARYVTPTAPPKLSLITWYFRKAAMDGMTNPFFLEIIIAGDLLPYERPHTLAHEWAHLAGYADESEANFVAWLACVRGTPLARYSAWLSAYEHLARVLPREDRQALREALQPIVVADLQAIRARLSRASPAVSAAARGAYDTYLRANRIEEGIANYGAVVRLLLGTTFEPGWTPELSRRP